MLTTPPEYCHRALTEPLPHCLHAQPAATLLVEELPCIGPVEATDTH